MQEPAPIVAKLQPADIVADMVLVLQILARLTHKGLLVEFYVIKIVVKVFAISALQSILIILTATIAKE